MAAPVSPAVNMRPVGCPSGPAARTSGCVIICVPSSASRVAISGVIFDSLARSAASLTRNSSICAALVSMPASSLIFVSSSFDSLASAANKAGGFGIVEGPGPSSRLGLMFTQPSGWIVGTNVASSAASFAM